ncbi:hypothetical protein L2Y94_05725 [Luteibacter aegosomatis]|uniref:hypothetical protein n=1 Tax=Luteibacter aegosomatis TaxID=2911537 RepID=UPI001FFB0E41|nr:hypothetical protein [Luteibacter aegosomatis]UPG86853.1 hypothetical protein L2Y94_05725 [Luteibacter aegosomatis]
MTDTAQLRDIMVTALKGATDIGDNVFPIQDWATWSGSYPVAYFQAPEEYMESLGRQGAPQFTVTATLTLMVRIERPAQVDNQGTVNTQVALEAIKGQVLRTLINYPPLQQLIQQVPFIRSRIDVDGEGAKNLGELSMQIGLEFYQGPEDFYPIPTDVLEEFTVTVDSSNVFDPTGTYPDPPFPDAVRPAPRTEGPDGRAEGGLDITFPP